MKRLFPLLLAAASFTIVGCNNQKKTAAAPNTGAQMNSQQPAPQPYQPPADTGMTEPQPAPAPETIPPSAGNEEQPAHSTHHHAYARHGKYIVRKGDTMSKIAHEHHVSLKHLEAANPKVNPNKIRVGQTIIIP